MADTIQFPLTAEHRTQFCIWRAQVEAATGTPSMGLCFRLCSPGTEAVLSFRFLYTFCFFVVLLACRLCFYA